MHSIFVRSSVFCGSIAVSCMFSTFSAQGEAFVSVSTVEDAKESDELEEKDASDRWLLWCLCVLLKGCEIWQETLAWVFWVWVWRISKSKYLFRMLPLLFDVAGVLPGYFPSLSPLYVIICTFHPTLLLQPILALRLFDGPLAAEHRANGAIMLYPMLGPLQMLDTLHPDWVRSLHLTLSFHLFCHALSQFFEIFLLGGGVIHFYLLNRRRIHRSTWWHKENYGFLARFRKSSIVWLGFGVGDAVLIDSDFARNDMYPNQFLVQEPSMSRNFGVCISIMAYISDLKFFK